MPCPGAKGPVAEAAPGRRERPGGQPLTQRATGVPSRTDPMLAGDRLHHVVVRLRAEQAARQGLPERQSLP
jgi:hypothetical protein